MHDDGGLDNAFLVDEHYLNSEVVIFKLFDFRNIAACDQNVWKLDLQDKHWLTSKQIVAEKIDSGNVKRKVICHTQR